MGHPTSPDTRRFDLHRTDPGLRTKIWTDTLTDYFYNYDIEYCSDFQFGEFQGVVVDELRIASMSADPVSVDRDARIVARDARDAYNLLVPYAGTIMLRQRGNETIVDEDQFTMVSAMEPYAYRQKRRAGFHTLIVPGALVRARKPDADDHLAGNFRGSVLQRIFADFAASFCRHAPDLGRDAFRRTHDSLLDLLALVLDDADTASNETAVQVAHRRRIVTIVESRFRDPRVDLISIAEAAGLSPRYVQHILAARGETVSDLVRRRRIAEACRLLGRRATSRASISAIAYAVGYADPAYFSRVFRRSTGMSPKDYSAGGAGAEGRDR